MTPAGRKAKPVVQAHTTISKLCVAQAIGAKSNGRLHIGQASIPCRLGPGGVAHDKREGDGATPAGHFRLARALYRANSGMRLPRNVPSRPIRKDDIWCDASGHGQYNRPGRLPFAPSHERLWREDHLYDLVFVLDYNLRPRAQGRGSAIFFHLERDRSSATAGCVAISAAAMRRLAPRLGKGVTMRIRR